ncbi:MAG: SMP-30/gluconolactonase/LRE family protein [Deltaproteobacteria bacterium]|nr:SMP-30/gluconolactonase/LRE family protein [Deltaproteobacteria bacterium]
MKIVTGRIETLASIPGKGFIEGPSYVPEDGHLYFVEIEAGWISRVTPEGKYEQFYNIGAPGDLMGPNGMIYDSKNKRLLIAHRDMGIVSLDPKKKKHEVIVGNYKGKKFNGPNDLIIDSNCNIFFSDPWGTSISNPVGVVYRVDATSGEIVPFMENLAFPNGVLISPNEDYIYVCEFGRNRVLRAMLLDGGRSHVFLHAMTYFSGGWGPDSMGMDILGNLYIGHFGFGKVFVLEPLKGEIIEVIEVPDPGGIGTDNARFGGPENKTLYITEGWKRVIYKVDVAIPGLAIPPPPPK